MGEAKTAPYEFKFNTMRMYHSQTKVASMKFP